MPLSRLENFLINTDGNILYVNPSDLDATDSFDNKGNSLTRPFVTLQRALIEAARFAYQQGEKNDRFDKTTILLYPGIHLIDNRPGFYIEEGASSNAVYKQLNVDGDPISVDYPNLDLNPSTNFDVSNSANVLYKFNSVHGGVIIPKGTSIVGMDLRKTKIKPLYVPDAADVNVDPSAIFRVTGGCYFWQFSIFDADRAVYYNRDYSKKQHQSKSHHKLTVFEYADGVNKENLTQLTDLEMYYFKLMNAYNTTVGDARSIPNFPFTDGTGGDFEPNNPEFRIVGLLRDSDLTITNATSSGSVAEITTKNKHGLNVDDAIYISGITSSLFNGGYVVSAVDPTNDKVFQYNLPTIPATPASTLDTNPRVIVETDNVNGASPYIFNLSLRSVYGMNGMHADGSKATGFKSMVVAQYTGIGLQKDDNAFVLYNQTTDQYDLESIITDKSAKPLHTNPNAIYRYSYKNAHVKASNDSIIQAVSVFAIGFAEHFLADNGADQSITNSNSNFGAKSLVSTGFKKDSFKRDNNGYVTHIVPPQDLETKSFNVLWRVLDVDGTINAGISSHLYLLSESDEDNPPSHIANGFRIGSKIDEVLSLDVYDNVEGKIKSFSSPILMQVPSGEGPSSRKVSTVSKDSSKENEINITSNEITLTEDHKFIAGESVRVLSDDGKLPNGIQHNEKYYVIPGSADNKIKLAKSYNTAVASTQIPINIFNKKGGKLEIISYVTDKIPGEPGHPIQYDTTRTQWYIIGSSDATNTIYSGFVGFSTNIKGSNPVTTFERKSENRELDSRTYRLRYVIPKEFQNAKEPEKNYVLQESSTVGEDRNFTAFVADSGIDIDPLLQNRNPHVIAGITSVQGVPNQTSIVTVTSERPHKLTVGDRVLIKNVASTENVPATDNEGFNGYYNVTDTPTTKTFRYTSPKSGIGTYINHVPAIRNAMVSSPGVGKTIASFAKNEYDTTYSIQKINTVQSYISGQQDGVYYLTCLIGNISPTTNQGFSNLKFKQNASHLYPTVDKDNLNVDPTQTISIASNEFLGKVNVNNPLNSITKESALEYIKDAHVGFAVTGAVSSSTGVSTIFTKSNHNLNSISGVSFVGTGYSTGAGIDYNVPLVNEQAGLTGQDATVNVRTNTNGNIVEVKVIDGGSAYGVGNTMRIGSGANAVATVTSINNAVGNAIQVVGVGTTGNLNTSSYNGLYKITGIPAKNSITYSTGTNPGIHTDSNGTAFLTDEISTISSITGVAGTTLSGIVTVTTAKPHGLFGGNKIKISGVTGTGSTVYNSDFLVQEVVTRKKFTLLPNYAIPSSSSGEIYRYGIGAFGQDSSFSDEKISGSMIPLTVGIGTTTNEPLTVTKTDLELSSSVGFSTGDFLQIGSEIVRVTNIVSNDLTLLRGVLGTKPTVHKTNNVIKIVKPVPTELRRFSSVRASGHTFEYVGYGPGNYSTALPQKRSKTLSNEDELLALSKEEKGGMVFFSGMNDRGDFFSGQRVEPRENFLGEDNSDLTAVFDDVYIRNTLTVGGGPNRLLPSEFRGPVNFTNKITSTSPDGINAIKLILKGTVDQNPFFQVGSDSSPSLVVNEETQRVGIQTDKPQFDLDINGTIRANAYEDFELEDLPIGIDEEVTFARNRVLKVKNDGTGYELVDVHELEAYRLKSYGISNDPTVYAGIGVPINAGVSTLPQTEIKGIGNTNQFYLGQKVKLFGASEFDGVASPPPDGQTFEKVGTADTVFKYRYWLKEYEFESGKVGVSSAMKIQGKNNQDAGIGHTHYKDFNDLNLIKLNLKRSSDKNGLLVYRQLFAGSDNPLIDIELAQTAVAGVSTIKLTDITGIENQDRIIGISSLSVHLATEDGPAGINTVQSINTSEKVITLVSPIGATGNIDVGTKGQVEDIDGQVDETNAKLIAILGPKDFVNASGDSVNTGVIWRDYGNYDQVEWTTKGSKNEYISPVISIDPTSGNYVYTGNVGDEIHFPKTANAGHRKGWAIDEVVGVSTNSISLKNSYKFNNDTTQGGAVGFGTTSVVHITHDNTYSLKAAINDTLESGGNYLNLGSGTYLAEKIVIPAGFTIAGNGKNSILKQQYYSNSADDHGIPKFTADMSFNSSTLSNVSDLTNLVVGMVVNIDTGGNTGATGTQTITAIDISAKTISLSGNFGGSGSATGAKFSAGNALSTDNGNFISVGVSSAKDVTIRDCTIDGNSSNNILYRDAKTVDEINNYLINLQAVDSSLFKSSEIRNSPGDGLYVGDTRRMSIENSAFVDGSVTDRFPFQPLSASNAKVLRVNDSLFENYPGALDVSATEVVMTGGNIIRNCGTGIRIHASSKITTTNNVILGPSDEYIPTPDIYDSDFNSINLTISTNQEFHTPFYQYIRNGSEYDLSGIAESDIVAGIGTIVNEGATNETLGDKFLMFTPTNQNSTTNGRQFGYLSFKLSPTDTASLVGSASSSLGYDIVASEFLQVPLGFTTAVYIKSGSFNTIGAGATNYTVALNDSTQHVAFAVGDIVKLVNHDSSPAIGFGTVSQKTTGLNATVTIDIEPVTSSLNVGATSGEVKGYISIRNTFTIAKGRVGVI